MEDDEERKSGEPDFPAAVSVVWLIVDWQPLEIWGLPIVCIEVDCKTYTKYLG
jgi:hypothetical protein